MKEPHLPHPLRCVLTGANRGLGLALTRALLQQGHAVVASCRHPSQAIELNQLASEYPTRLHVLLLDVADSRSQAEFVRELPLRLDGIDLLINNAGVMHSGERFGHVRAEVLEDSLRINAIGPFLLTQALAPLLAEAGKVANISSELGSITRVSRFGTPSYGISKAALNMATALLAHALNKRDITVVALHPGWVQTDMGGQGAAITPEQSAHGLLQVISRIGPDDSGQFLDWQGHVLEW